MKKVEIRDSVFEVIKALRSEPWSELCENDVFFSEFVEVLLMGLIVEQKAYIEAATIKAELEDKIKEYKKGGIPEWRMKNEKKQ